MNTTDKEQEKAELAARKKKILLISVGSGVATLAVGWLIWLAIFSSQFITFTENNYHIAIKYPRGWTVAPGYAGTVVTFVSPKEDGLDTFQENLNIAVMDLSQQPMTLEQYSELAIKQMNAVFKTNIEVVESKPITYAGGPAYKYKVKAPNPDDLILTIIWFIRDNQAYTITYIGQALFQEKYQPKFDEMVRSFSIPTL